MQSGPRERVDTEHLQFVVLGAACWGRRHGGGCGARGRGRHDDGVLALGRLAHADQLGLQAALQLDLLKEHDARNRMPPVRTRTL